MQRATDEIKKGCERDIRKIDDRLRLMEKKMWSYCWFSCRNIILGQYARSKTATKFLDSDPTAGYNRTSKVAPIHNGSG